MRDYEILYILRPDLEESRVGEAASRVSGLIENLGGKHERTNAWGKRRLAYEVGRFREGYYVLQEFQLEPARIPELERSLKISDEVFRHLVVRRPEKAKVAVVGPMAEAVAAAEAAPAAAAAPQGGEEKADEVKADEVKADEVKADEGEPEEGE